MNERTPEIAKGPRGLGQKAAAFIAGCTRSDSRDERGSEEALRIWGRENGRVLADSFFAELDLVSNTTSEEEIRTLMRGLGFTDISASFYGWRRDDGTVVLDAKPDNFIKSAAGIIPIDLQITRGF